MLLLLFPRQLAYNNNSNNRLMVVFRGRFGEQAEVGAAA
jgi:hypothetical protein